MRSKCQIISEQNFHLYFSYKIHGKFVAFTFAYFPTEHLRAIGCLLWIFWWKLCNNGTVQQQKSSKLPSGQYELKNTIIMLSFDMAFTRPMHCNMPNITYSICYQQIHIEGIFISLQFQHIINVCKMFILYWTNSLMVIAKWPMVIAKWLPLKPLTHLPLVPHASVNRVSIGSDNGLSLIRRQAII